MTDIFDLIQFEEGFSEKPYIDTLGYPTIGFGFKIGPKGSPLKNYTFTTPRSVAVSWMQCILNDKIAAMRAEPSIRAAYNACADGPVISPRQAVLISMAYQMGIEGLAKFKNTLSYIIAKDFNAAAKNMSASLWARQTPKRAKRHIEQMRTGQWAPEYPA